MAEKNVKKVRFEVVMDAQMAAALDKLRARAGLRSNADWVRGQIRSHAKRKGCW